jgi:hypothetical protein
MFSRRDSSLATIAGACKMFVVPTVALAAISTSPAVAGSATSSHRISEDCGFAEYRAPNGTCQPILDASRNCQPGFHNVPTPVANGYRCVQDGY